MKYSYDFGDKNKIKRKRIVFISLIIIISLSLSAFLFKNSQNFLIKTVSNVIITPFELITTTTQNTFLSIGSYFKNINKLNLQNEILENKINELELKLLESQTILDENKSLKKQLDISTTFQHFKLKHARIIIREHDNFSQSFIVNVGFNDGIKINQPVIHNEGLIGYISSVNENTSIVTTILDPRTSVSVTISTINEPAILKGNLELKANNNLKLEYIPIDSEISIGDMLYSSGLGSMFTASIPVGRVVKIVNKKNDSDRYAIVEPCVNIRSIKEVSIIIE